MAHPSARLGLVASVVACAVLAVASPASATEGGEWPFDYVRCYDVQVELPDRTPVITVCSPV